jgi:hypothetical protein
MGPDGIAAIHVESAVAPIHHILNDDIIGSGYMDIKSDRGEPLLDNGYKISLGAYKNSASLMISHSTKPGIIELRTKDEKETNIILRHPDISIGGYGERVIIGDVDLATKKTGAIIKQPISSITLFSNKGNVLWPAP